MSDLAAQVRKPDGMGGYEDAFTLDIQSSEETREFDRLDLASLFALRRDVNNVNLEEDIDRIYLEDSNNNTLFGGVLKTIARTGGGNTELIVESFERLARNAQPTPGGQRYEGATDTTIIQDAIDGVPDLSAGTLTSDDGNVTMVFSHASPANKMRTIGESTNAFTRFNADRTVDYQPVSDYGSTRTTTLSPDNQNIIDTFQPKLESGDTGSITHLRMIGAGEGDSQIVANIVPADDSASYRNKFTYTSSWTSGDPKNWTQRSNKDITDTTRLGKTGQVVIKELNTEVIEIETVIEGLDVTLGDEFPVQHTEEEIDTTLRVVEHTRKIQPTGTTHDVVLSNQVNARQSEADKMVKDTERYNRAFEGTNVTLTTGGGRQPVNSTLDYEFSFYYPDEVAYEHRVKLFVKGLAYRAYSQGAASGGDHTHSFEYIVTGRHDHSITEANFDHTHDLTTTTSADDHDHSSGSYDADDHDHPQNINVISDDDDRGGEGSTAKQIEYIGESSFGDLEFSVDSVAGGAAWAIVVASVRHLTSSGASFILAEPQLYNDSKGREFLDGTQDGALDPGESKTFMGVTQAQTGEDISGDTVSVNVSVNTTCDFAIYATSFTMGFHSHDLNITSPTGNFAPGVAGVSGNEEPDVTGGTETPNATSTTEAEQETTSSVTTTGNKDHTHDPEPGIIESFGGTRYYPSNVDVVVNGSAVGVSLGDGTGTFEQQVDLEGELVPGQVNTIGLSSDTLGHLQAHVDVDVYRQILGDG